MDELTAGDIMEKEVFTIRPEATISKLAELLADKKISGVPVVDEEGRLLGVVTEGDVIYQDAELHFPHYISFLDSVIYLESVKKFEQRFRKAFGARVEDIMSTDVITADPETSIHDIATLMIEKEINRLPVVEGDMLIGIITRADVVRAMARERTED